MSSAPPFSHLHLHTEYSILDGACQVKPLVAKVGDMEMGYVGITDHGTMAGTVELYQQARKAGIKPVLGMEAYVTPDHLVKTTEGGQRSETTHLTLFAASNTGWRNLLKLSSLGCLEGMYYKPRVDYDWMSQHSEGIIALTGCMASKTQQLILNGDRMGAAAEVGRLVDIFGRDNVYVEFQDNGVVDERSGMSQRHINDALAAIMRDQNLRGVVTSDVHYLTHNDAIPHDALLCIQTKARIADERRFRFSTDQFYLKSPDEMWQAWRAFDNADELFRNTVEIGERCNVELQLGINLLPDYPCPDGHDADSYLRELCEEGAIRRYGDPLSGEVRERLEFELATISRMGYSAYFLITWDWINWAKEQGIPIGPGRGSAAGAIVAYTLGITDLDPFKYGLLFERFLNPDRVSMPDIDTDIAQAGRERAIRYLTDKYGADHVAQISTFGRMAPKAAVKDAARVMDYPVAIGDRVSKLIPDGPGQSFAKNMEAGQELRKEYDADETVRAVVDMATPLEGMVRNTGIHAAAVVIGNQPLANIVPLRAGEHGDQIVTQFEQGVCESLGLLKMDVLGLRNLDVLQKVVEFIQQSRGETIDVAQIPLDDAKTFDMIQRGDCVGVFQLESEGMQSAARQIRPTKFEDIVALVAMYRPGPMEYIPQFAANKRNPDGIEYADDRLKPILEETYGITCYQEQYMMIAKALAGFTPGEADELRKGIAKKKRDVLDAIKPKFMLGCTKNDVDTAVAKKLWDDAEKAGDYSFNKSHAACYALISYQTAYLKANYPSEYMAALISTVMHTKDKVPFFVAACAGMGINVLPPDVNESFHDFRVLDDGSIRFGLMAVKGVGESAIDDIIRARNDRPFATLWDFCERVDKTQANKRVLEALVKAGAFDSTQGSRKGMLAVLAQAMAAGAKVQEDAAIGQFDLFGGLGDTGGEGGVTMEHPPISEEEFSRLDRLDLEREVTGLYMSGHPIDEWRSDIDARTEHAVADVLARGEDINRRTQETGAPPPGVVRGKGGDRTDNRALVKVGGLVKDYRPLVNKTGKPMAFFTLEGTDQSSIRVVVFNSVFEKCREKLAGDRRVVIVRARLEAKEGSVDLMAEHVMSLDEAPQINAITVLAPKVRLGEPGVLGELTRILSNYPGEATIDFRVTSSDGETTLRLGDGWRVKIDSGLKDELRELLGPQAVI